MTYITAMMLSLYLTNPIVTLAQGLVESNLNHLSVGDSGRSKGAFQVQAKHWGRVPNNLLDQAKQCERIRTGLDNDIWTAVRKYNGSGRQARSYEWKVKKQAIQIAML